ncbi:MULTISPECIES: acyl carrier protein [unclassified Pseudomonas]|uniref:acyl carrier protein n=1 Tax=unclassified Pseudomonas TaxID=196821 RepID=UPI000871317A|nr:MULTISPECIES: acyl carrier protein [unclassified Pseudomonas]SCW31176.1 Phosphopantetheine attachment site [Pseudomonas sp. NFACC05-1]SDY54086.1 Phosphopantetheine attachment site [Pseudomonas sp. NFACC08-1]SEI49944.1 Phosphopantetheine attachment site [Pseudomonas sp. NFACC07-1]SFL07229.1 Phosphopantetheine attachment site [Pseudomonas sp. NFACC46-3]
MIQSREDAVLKPALKELVRDLLLQATGLAPASLHDEAPFHEIGLTSLAILDFNERIQPVFLGLNKTLLFDWRCGRAPAARASRGLQPLLATAAIEHTPSPVPPHFPARGLDRSRSVRAACTVGTLEIVL